MTEDEGVVSGKAVILVCWKKKMLEKDRGWMCVNLVGIGAKVWKRQI